MTYAGANRSKPSSNITPQRIVYTTFTGNSMAVNSSGKRLTCPATASGRKAPRYRRSLRAMRLKGMMTSKMAFSWTCQPKRKEEYPQRVMVAMKFVHVGTEKSLRRAGCEEVREL